MIEDDVSGWFVVGGQAFPSKKVLDIAENLTVPANSYVDSDVVRVSYHNGGQLFVLAEFASGASAGLRVLFLYSADGENWDDEQEAINEGNYIDVGYDEAGNFVKAGSSSQRSTVIPIVAPYVKFRFRNLDGANSLVVKTVKLALVR